MGRARPGSLHEIGAGASCVSWIRCIFSSEAGVVWLDAQQRCRYSRYHLVLIIFGSDGSHTALH